MVGMYDQPSSPVPSQVNSTEGSRVTFHSDGTGNQYGATQ